MIEAENASFTYQSAPSPALQDVTLTVQPGECVVLCGRSGCGKTTFTHLLNGLSPEFYPGTLTGRCTAAGLAAGEAAIEAYVPQVGSVFQNPKTQYFNVDTTAELAFPCENAGMEPQAIRRRVDEALKRVGMYEFRNNAPHLLSGGQKQRVAIAGVLAMQPEILVMDEPTAMLDPSGRQEVLRTIADLRAATGVTVVLITHHMDECIDADRLLVVSDGKLVLDGTPKDVFSRVEQMRSIGLDVPATTETLYELRAAGADVPLGALSDAEAADAIVRWLGN